MGERTWPQLISALLRSEELSSGDTTWAMDEIMSGSASPVQIAAFAVALRAKGETPAEVGGLVDSMLSNAVRVRLDEAVRADAVDVAIRDELDDVEADDPSAIRDAVDDLYCLEVGQPTGLGTDHARHE